MYNMCIGNICIHKCIYIIYDIWIFRHNKYKPAIIKYLPKKRPPESESFLPPFTLTISTSWSTPFSPGNKGRPAAETTFWCLPRFLRKSGPACGSESSMNQALVILKGKSWLLTWKGCKMSSKAPLRQRNEQRNKETNKNHFRGSILLPLPILLRWFSCVCTRPRSLIPEKIYDSSLQHHHQLSNRARNRGTASSIVVASGFQFFGSKEMIFPHLSPPPKKHRISMFFSLKTPRLLFISHLTFGVLVGVTDGSTWVFP